MIPEYGKNDKYYFTVGKLIDVLKTMPQDLPILTSGQESGFENFFHPYVVKLKHEPENWSKDGEFQTPDEGDKDTFEAVILKRVLRDD